MSTMQEYVAALDEVKQGVHALTNAVEGYRKDAVDRSTVESIVTDLLEKQGNVASTRRSFTPSDAGGGGQSVAAILDERAQELRTLRGNARLERFLELPAARAAEATGKRADDVERFQEVSDTLLLTAAIMGRPPQTLDFYGDTYRPAFEAAVSTGGAGSGEEYVPTILSNQLIERVNLDLLIANLFEQVEMPSNPYELPGVALSRQQVKRATEQSGDPGPTAIEKITLATRKVTLTAKKLAVMALISKEEEEDAVIATLPWLQRELADYLSGSIEDGVMNGDTAGTHQDSDVTDADDPRKLYDGLRKVGLTESTDGGNAALTVAMLRVNRKRMGKYGVRPNRLAHIVSMANAIQLLGDSSVLTLMNYGPQATILTGELAKVDNIPIIVSEYAREDLNASGVYDDVTTNRSAAVTVYVPGFVVGTRRSLTIELLRELYSEFDQDAVKVTARKAFQERYPHSSEPIAAATFNLSIA